MERENGDLDGLVTRGGIDSLWRAIHRDIRKRGIDAHTADDVAQETWLRTVSSPPRRADTLRSWLRVVALRVLAQTLRSERLRRGREGRVARGEVSVRGHHLEDDSRVMRLVARLPSPYREVISLRYVEDLEVEEIAHKLGTTPGTVRSQLKRGLDRLRVRLEQGGEDGPETQRRSLIAWLGIRRNGEGMPGILRWASVGFVGVVALVAVVAWIWRDERGPRVQVAASAGDQAPPSLDSIATGGAPTVAVRSVQEPSTPPVDPLEDLFPRRPAFGTVRLPDGSPVPGAAVWKGDVIGEKAQFLTTADAEGRFALDSVEVSRVLWATHPGWWPSRRCHSGSIGAGHPTDLVLTAPSGRLELFVREEDGRPLAGAEVELDWGFADGVDGLMAESGEIQVEAQSVSGRTDERGRLELPRLAPSDVRIRIQAPGRARHVETRSLASGDSSLELVLTRSRLTGTVVDALGEPVPRARVELHPGDVRECTLVEASESGAFELALGPGPFELRVRGDARQSRLSGWVEGTLEQDEHRDLRVVLTEDGVVAGRAVVMGVPFADGFVTYLATWPVCVRTELGVRTDAEGRFCFVGFPPRERVTLKLHTAGLELLCELENVHVGTKDVLLSSETDPTERSLELEFDCAPELLPALVEMRVARLSKARAFPVDAATKRCTVVVPQATPFDVVPWIPGLGSWRVDGSELGSSGLQRIHVPQPARVVFLTDLPAGTAPDSLRLEIRGPGFGASWASIVQRGWRLSRRLRIDPSTLCAEARLLPGLHRYFLLGEGVANAGGGLRIEEGGDVREDVRVRPGIEADVRISITTHQGREVPILAVRTPDRWWELEGIPLRIEDAQVTYRACLPADTLELEAFGLHGWYGSKRVAREQLESPRHRPEFVIQPGPNDPDALNDRRRAALGRRRK